MYFPLQDAFGQIAWQPWFMLALVALVFVGLAMNRAADALSLGSAIGVRLAAVEFRFYVRRNRFVGRCVYDARSLETRSVDA